jgi:hypothetical protein
MLGKSERLWEGLDPVFRVQPDFAWRRSYRTPFWAAHVDVHHRNPIGFQPLRGRAHFFQHAAADLHREGTVVLTGVQ